MRSQAVYIIRLNGLYKIGRSVDPRGRIAGLQLPGEPDIICIGWTEDAVALEALLHEYFSEQRRHGEWFFLSPDDLNRAVERIHLRQLAEADMARA